MYINLSELTHLKVIVDKMQDIIETQTAQKNGNELFPETSLFEMREFCNKAEEIIKTVEDREVRSRAKNIIRKRIVAIDYNVPQLVAVAKINN